jgi:hypothetical protein
MPITYVGEMHVFFFFGKAQWGLVAIENSTLLNMRYSCQWHVVCNLSSGMFEYM